MISLNDYHYQNRTIFLHDFKCYEYHIHNFLNIDTINRLQIIHF